MEAKSRRCLGCKASKNNPCPKALERIHNLQAEGSSKDGDPSIFPGCDWYVNSAEYGYSFWNLVKDLHGSPMTDREICQLLLITPAQLKETYNSAIKKLVDQKDTPVIRDFLELIQELANHKESDNTTYMPDSFRDKITETGEANENEAEAPEEDEKKGKKRGRKKITNGLGMPIHRSGNKVDIYFSTPKKKKK